MIKKNKSQNILRPFMKLQLSALSPVLLLCIFLFPISSLKVSEYRGSVIFCGVIIMSAFFITNSFGVSDGKYNIKYLFNTLPVTPSVIIGTRWTITYGLVILAMPAAKILSYFFVTVSPDVLQTIQVSPLLNGFLLAAVVIPLNMLIYSRFSAERASVIGSVLVAALIVLLTFGQEFFGRFLSGQAWMGNFVLAVCVNYLCLKSCISRYKKEE